MFWMRLLMVAGLSLRAALSLSVQELSDPALWEANTANLDMDVEPDFGSGTVRDELAKAFEGTGAATDAIRKRFRDILLSPSYFFPEDSPSSQGDAKLLRLADLLFLDDHSSEQTPRMNAFIEDEQHLASVGSVERAAYDTFVEEPTMYPSPVTRNLANVPPSVIALLKNKTAGGVDRKGLLTDSCANQMCEFLQYQLSCKAQNLGMIRTCAKYFVGFVYGCPAFPAPSDFYSAPSVCLTEVVSFFAGLSKTPSNLPFPVVPMQTKILRYLNASTFTTNVCGRNCYQLYQSASNNFYSQCYSQLAQFNKSLPIVFSLSNFQQFRNQACSRNPGSISGKTLTNCYVALNVMQSKPPPIPINLFDFGCNFTAYGPSINVLAGSQSCTQFTGLGCCAGQAIQMTVQNPVGLIASIGGRRLDEVAGSVVEYYNVMSGEDVFTRTATFLDVNSADWKAFEDQALREAHAMVASQQEGDVRTEEVQTQSQSVGASLDPNSLKLFPPCLFQYWTSIQSATCNVQLQNTCNNGSYANQATVQGAFKVYQFAGVGTFTPMPNLFVKTQVLYTQGVISKLLLAANASLAKMPFNLGNPLQIMITGYTYYNATGGKLKTPPTVSGSPYLYSASMQLTFQVTVQNVNNNELNSIAAAIANPIFSQGLAKTYGFTAPSKVPGAQVISKQLFTADPLTITKNSAQSSAVVSTSITAILMLMISYCMMMMQ